MINERFEVKFATTRQELDAVYKLRYEDLVLEYNGASQNADDASYYDKYAKHLIVKEVATGQICGYYRMITSDVLSDGNKFVCEEEFDVDTLKAQGDKICEFSRAVVKKEFRGGMVLLLLWKFILNYMLQNGFRYLIGDASFFGTDREKYTDEISYLINNYACDPSLKILSRDSLPPMQIVDTSSFDGREMLHRLPPLIRGYVAVGAKVAPQPYTDFVFGSVDVFILVDLQNCNTEYVNKLLGNK
ncbi:MAG: GNAT family N-acetyltransferase [Corallococcus sp.]|nr:GNAT family N-acetyltransferase [Corallococcus sp.]MCM1359812.1 GNAT family N-acetyltransferase [Corallococcus sp.]MCM1395246.1 GNAT family N-acetyltransferase [Corallococcus sp.]